jgi:hypothetical protein
MLRRAVSGVCPEDILTSCFLKTYFSSFLQYDTILSMKRGYVSELQPPMAILLISQMIFEHGGRWWDYIDRRKLLILQPGLSGNSISSDLEAKQDEIAKNIMNFDKKYLLHTHRVL